MIVFKWLSDNYIEVFGAVTGIIYVFLEIRQTIWLWPVGILTSAVYIWIFFTSKFYADMSLQGYYLVISCLGWYWWTRGVGLKKEWEKGREGEGEINSTGHRAQGIDKSEWEKGREGEGEINSTGHRAQGIDKSEWEKGREGEGEKEELHVTRLKLKTGVVLSGVFVLLFFLMWLILSKLTDSPVPIRDSFITSLSIIATWMLARKIYEHWYLWIAVNFVSAVLFVTRGLYPTFILYLVYGLMSFIGLLEWKKTIRKV